MRLPALLARQLTTQCLLALIVFLGHRAALGAEASYYTILIPGALGTFPMSINNSTTITGYYTTSPSTASAFIRELDGTLTTFTVPGALWTEPENINNLGDIAGFYEMVADEPSAFVRYANGRIATFQPPVNPPVIQAAVALVINDYDEVVGNFPWPNSASSAFVRSRTGGITRFTYSQGASYPTGVTDLNSNGAVVGYTSSANPYTSSQGFILHPDGYLVRFNVPLEANAFYGGTFAEAVNDDGVVAGWYSQCVTYGCFSLQTTGGFVRSAQGDFTVFNPPGTLVRPLQDNFYGSTSYRGPRSLSMNTSGSIAGTYFDAGQITHGFVRNPYGTITSFDPPSGVQTNAVGINDSGAITGSFYYDWNGSTSVGYLRVPQS